MMRPMRGRCVCRRLDRVPEMVGSSREWVRKTLPGWGLYEHADLVELVVSELVTNAIRHGDGQVELRMSCLEDELRIEVDDHGAGRPILRQAGGEQENGRGLTLIKTLIEAQDGAWGVADHDSDAGKTVWAAVPLPQPPADA